MIESVFDKLSAATAEYDSEAIKQIYFENFDVVNEVISNGGPEYLNTCVDFLMSIRSFKRASFLWRIIYNRSKYNMKQHRFVKMIRCLYYSGDKILARDIIKHKIQSLECSEKDKAILFSVMAESGDESYLDLLGDGLKPPSLGDKFYKDRSAFLSSEYRHGHAPSKKFIFVSGTPRSGTTSLGGFLNAHKNICMTTERYGPGNGYTKAMFDRDDLFYDSAYKKKYRSIYERYNECSFVGDKRPNFLMSWGLTKRNFRPEDIFVIHLLRDPYLVAESYFKRAKKSALGQDVWSSKNISPRDQFVACWDFNINNKILKDIFLEGGYSGSFFVVNNESLYSNESLLLEIFEHLGLDIDGNLRVEARRLVEKSKQLSVRREISNSTIDFVDKYLDFNLFSEVKKFCHY